MRILSLQDHFKSLRVEEQLQREEEQPKEKLDLSLKEGQTIKVRHKKEPFFCHQSM